MFLQTRLFTKIGATSIRPKVKLAYNKLVSETLTTKQNKPWVAKAYNLIFNLFKTFLLMLGLKHEYFQTVNFAIIFAIKLLTTLH